MRKFAPHSFETDTPLVSLPSSVTPDLVVLRVVGWMIRGASIEGLTLIFGRFFFIRLGNVDRMKL